MQTTHTTPELARYVCWEAEAPARVLTTEATAGLEAQFMATHTAIWGFGMRGAMASEVAEPTEDDLLATLSQPGRRHAFVAIEGEPGSGKSHLIRWLKVVWPTVTQERDLVVLINRADGSLEGTLRQLRERLPAQYREYLAGIGQVAMASMVGRVKMFSAALAATTNSDFYENDNDLPLDAQWLDTFKVERLLEHPEVRDKWEAPRRILEILSGKGGDRDSELAAFTFADMAQLGEIAGRLEPRDRLPLRLQSALEEEARWLRRALAEGRDVEAESENLKATSRLKDALTARINHAVRNLLGISGHQLKDVFRQLRSALKRDGKRLILLLEDIANFQGVDDQLIEVLIEDAHANDAVCDMVSVVGITPDYYRLYLESRGNLVQRINLRVMLGAADGSAGDAGNAVSDPEGRLRFTANYLRAVRVPGESLATWYGAALRGAVPNRCTACARKDACHATFGSYHFDPEDPESAVGFYPLSPDAVDRLFLALRDPAAKVALQTPRGLLQNVLTPVLSSRDQLAKGLFPPATIEHANIPESERELLEPSLERRLGEVIAAGPMRERLRRLIVWWGRRGVSARTELGSDGVLRFANVPRTIFEAFELPWPGGPAVTLSPGALTPPVQHPVTAPSLSIESTATAWMADRALASEVERPAVDRSERTVPHAPDPAPRMSQTTKAASIRIKPDEVADRRAELALWMKGDALPNTAFWSAYAYELIKPLPWKVIGLDAWVRQRLFTPDTVTLAGAKSAKGYHFVLPRADWVRSALDSLLVLKTSSDLGREDAEAKRRDLARFLRRVEPSVVAHAVTLLPDLDEKRSWSPAPMLAQLLQARTWLRGTTRPDLAPAVQWDSLFGADGDAVTAPERRTISWNETVIATARHHDEWRRLLLTSVNLPIDVTHSDFTFADAGAVAEALRQLREHATFLPVPTHNLRQARGDWEALARAEAATTQVTAGFAKLPAAERRRLLDAFDELDRNREGLALTAFLHDGVALVERVGHLLPNIAPHMRVQAEKAKQSLEQKDLWRNEPGSPLRTVDDFLAGLDPERVAELSTSDTLAWLLAMPYRHLFAAVDASKEIAGALRIFAENVDTLIGGGQDGAAPGIESVQDGGRALAAAGIVLSAMGGTNDRR